jgi:two-component system sensor histidine kinase KdpD
LKRSDRLKTLIRPTLLMVAVTACAWLLRDSLTLANFTMIYFLVVLVLAIWHGTQIALVASIVSFLCTNYLLIRPYYTFIVADPRELVDLFVFFVVAVLAGQLAARERQHAQSARQSAYEQEILYRLTRSFNQLTTSEGVYSALIETLKTDLSALDASVLPHSSIINRPEKAAQYVVLQANDRIYGTLYVNFDQPLTQEKSRLLNTCTLQAATALQRIDLAERAQRSQQFEDADRLKTALLHAVSHDLRTPVTIIKTSVHNLRVIDERLSAEERSEALESIEQESDRLDNLIGNLLDLSRLRAGAMTLNLQQNSLEEIAGDVAAYAFQRAKRERVRLNFPDEFPLLKFDYGLVLQAVSNLMDNALRFEPVGSTIEIVGTVAEGEARLALVNHGENITGDERENLMKPFYHGKHGQTGLGLAIANGIIELHRGRIWIGDTPGGGATFVVALPLEG